MLNVELKNTKVMFSLRKSNLLLPVTKMVIFAQENGETDYAKSIFNCITCINIL